MQLIVFHELVERFVKKNQEILQKDKALLDFVSWQSLVYYLLKMEMPGHSDYKQMKDIDK